MLIIRDFRGNFLTATQIKVSDLVIRIVDQTRSFCVECPYGHTTTDRSGVYGDTSFRFKTHEEALKFSDAVFSDIRDQRKEGLAAPYLIDLQALIDFQTEDAST